MPPISSTTNGELDFLLPGVLKRLANLFQIADDCRGIIERVGRFGDRPNEAINGRHPDCRVMPDHLLAPERVGKAERRNRFDSLRFGELIDVEQVAQNRLPTETNDQKDDKREGHEVRDSAAASEKDKGKPGDKQSEGANGPAQPHPA